MVPELSHVSIANGLRAHTRPKWGQQLVNTMLLLIPTQHTYYWWDTLRTAVLPGLVLVQTSIQSVTVLCIVFLHGNVMINVILSVQVKNEQRRDQAGNPRDGWERRASQRYAGAGKAQYLMNDGVYSV